MADPIPFEDHVEALKLRAQPKPTTRINRRIVILGVGILLLCLFAAITIALKPPTIAGDGARKELYNITNQPTAEQVSALPSNYTEMKSPVVPVLGDPLPGDLGATIRKTEQDLGITPQTDPYARDFRPNAEEEAARAERIRLAKLEQESLAAPILFQLSNTRQPISQQPSRSAIIDSNSFDGFELFPSETSPLSVSDGFGRPIDENFQNSKTAFANSRIDEDIYNPHSLQDPRSPYQVMAGQSIAASLLTGLNSDLPGSIIAQITQPVYDTATGQHLLIPQGSRLIGRYDSGVSFGQERALIVWDRLIFPDSSSIRIESLPGVDSQGFSGLRDRVDNHYSRLIGAIGLATILGVSTELTFGNDESDLVEAIRNSLQNTTNQAGQRIVDRNLNIQPTIRVRPGWPLRVLVTRDLILRPYSQIP